ncbi:MAG: glutathione S-transferase [Rickettsiales bacterium]|jgi:glutathione S-transferase|nr:glutathione S-transferase [Rickettsiales bacterium]
MTNNLPILYSFRRCPYAIRSRLALIYSNIKCELREVDLKNKPKELLNISPKATVPVLVCPDGTIIDESIDIIHYALKQNDPDGWALQQPELSDIIIKRNDIEFTDILRKYKYHERYSDSQEVYLKQAEKIFITWLEKQLEQNYYVTGSKISIADIAIFPFIRQFAKADQQIFDNSNYVCIKRWLQNFTDNPILHIAMKKNTKFV